MTHGPLWWAQAAIDLIESGSSAALVSVVATEGSAPRDAGTRMIVTDQQVKGTIGGGNLEFQLITQARRLLNHADASVLQQDYPLGPLLAQCCGGRVRVLVERLEQSGLEWLRPLADAAAGNGRWTLEGHVSGGRLERRVRAGWGGRSAAGIDLVDKQKRPVGMRQTWTGVVERIDAHLPNLYLFGAGHVGKAIANIARTLPLRLVWIDSRPELMLECDASDLICGDPLEFAGNAPANSFFLVLTHSHELDYAIVRALLARGDAAFCGLIGSATKRARFASRLEKEGIRPSQLVCPIGGCVIRSKDPACIAVSVSAELVVQLEAGVDHDVRSPRQGAEDLAGCDIWIQFD